MGQQEVVVQLVHNVFQSNISSLDHSKCPSTHTFLLFDVLRVRVDGGFLGGSVFLVCCVLVRFLGGGSSLLLTMIKSGV